MTDRACPLGFIMFATFATLLLWVFTLLQQVPIR